MVERSKIEESLKTVFDPEICLDVFTMGLIYDIKIDGSIVQIKMTLTTPLCPYGGFLIDSVKDVLKKIDGISVVDVELVFDPPWVPPPEVRMMLGV